MSSLTRRDLLKGVFGSTVATLMMSQANLGGGR